MRTKLFAFTSTLLLAACGAEPAGAPLGTMTQAIRAGAGDDGQTFLGAELLVTEMSGDAVPCGVGSVEFTVEVSRNGEAGPYQLIDKAEVFRTCSSPSQGQLAMVLDNSQSLDDELDTLKGAALRVSDTVIDRGGQVSLTRVSTNAKILSGLSSDREALRTAIDEMFVTNGWTSLYDGVRMANETLGMAHLKAGDQRFENADGFCNMGGSQSILVFTDGGENNSRHQMHYSESYPGDGINTSLGDLLQLNVAASTTPVYTVGLGEEADHQALNGLAHASGGRHVAMDDPGDIEDVLSMLAEYNESTHRVCTKLPDHVCGSVDVRIGHRFVDGERVMQGSSVRHLDLPCPVRARGRVATMLLTLDASDMQPETVNRLVAQTINWVSPVDAPRVLFLRDDFHHDEFAYETSKLYTTLTAAGYTASFVDEAADGIGIEELASYDVVWFSNPGYPMDDLKTFNALRQFSEAGGGVVMQGDDMSWSHGSAFPTEPLTQLRHIDNGTEYCGQNIDNGSGEYKVTLPEVSHPILAGLEGQSFRYTDDIDTAELITGSSEGTSEVLAWATVEGGKNKNKVCGTKPVIVAFTPNAPE
jgi:hypothetical protein